jgi:hypothetical protein
MPMVLIAIVVVSFRFVGMVKRLIIVQVVLAIIVGVADTFGVETLAARTLVVLPVA